MHAIATGTPLSQETIDGIANAANISRSIDAANLNMTEVAAANQIAQQLLDDQELIFPIDTSIPEYLDYLDNNPESGGTLEEFKNWQNQNNNGPSTPPSPSVRPSTP
jgi:uncharacterized protein (DUF1778 family)